MISKNRISQIRKLHAKKFRDESGLFLVEGYKSVEMLCVSDFEVEEIFATENALTDNAVWLSSLSPTLVTAEEMSRISTMQTPPELLAIALQPQSHPDIPANQPVLALDHISDPGNLGTIIRTADWFDIQHVVCSPDCVEFYNPKVIQATMGSFTHIHVHYRSLPEFLKQESSRRHILGTFLDGEDIRRFEFNRNDIVVIGNESNGISEEVANAVTHRITIPTAAQGRDTAESLNAAIAAAVVMYRMAGC
ncbi:MAG: RNA methyltransferase [Bacteroidales bacterium]|nr:RNA methyltransferase [Bacteroidales bacterium]